MWSHQIVFTLQLNTSTTAEKREKDHSTETNMEKYVYIYNNAHR